MKSGTFSRWGRVQPQTSDLLLLGTWRGHVLPKDIEFKSLSPSKHLSNCLHCWGRSFLSNKLLILHTVEIKHIIWTYSLYLYSHHTLEDVHRRRISDLHSSQVVRFMGKTPAWILPLAQREHSVYCILRSNVVMLEKKLSYHHRTILFVQTSWSPINNSLRKESEKGFFLWERKWVTSSIYML